jgi:predicted DNA-binding transcriptional regulator AlpA
MQSIELMNEKDVAKALLLSVHTIRQLRVRGEGPRFIRIGKTAIRYRVSDLEEYINSIPSTNKANKKDRKPKVQSIGAGQPVVDPNAPNQMSMFDIFGAENKEQA